MASDNGGSANGWRVDNVAVTTYSEGTPCPSPTSTPTAPLRAIPSATLHQHRANSNSYTAARPLNLSTRMLVQTGDEVSIGGFIITGPAPKQIVVRGIGPELAQFGVPNPLADPVLELHGPAGFTTLVNDNWRTGPGSCCSLEGPCTPTGLPPTDDLESMICATLDPGAYTAIVRGQE